MKNGKTEDSKPKSTGTGNAQPATGVSAEDYETRKADAIRELEPLVRTRVRTMPVRVGPRVCQLISPDSLGADEPTDTTWTAFFDFMRTNADGLVESKCVCVVFSETIHDPYDDKFIDCITELARFSIEEGYEELPQGGTLISCETEIVKSALRQTQMLASMQEDELAALGSSLDALHAWFESEYGCDEQESISFLDDLEHVGVAYTEYRCEEDGLDVYHPIEAKVNLVDLTSRVMVDGRTCAYEKRFLSLRDLYEYEISAVESGEFNDWVRPGYELVDKWSRPVIERDPVAHASVF